MNGKFFVTRSGQIKQKTSLSFLTHRALTLFYLLNGRRSATKGYGVYCREFLGKLAYDSNLLKTFKMNQCLPKGYGYRIDERVVEYPWVLARLSSSASTVLDAGSTLNFEYLLEHPSLSNKTVVIYTLSPQGENKIVRPNISYIYGDLRKTILRDSLFDEIVCISTIEHIGMDNTKIYTRNDSYREERQDDYTLVAKELQRVLKPTGKLLLTVPFGYYQNLGWLQQFDKTMVKRFIEAFDGTVCQVSYYKYYPDGWQLSTQEECLKCKYNNPLTTSTLASDGAVTAQAVACLELTK